MIPLLSTFRSYLRPLRPLPMLNIDRQLAVWPPPPRQTQSAQFLVEKPLFGAREAMFWTALHSSLSSSADLLMELVDRVASACRLADALRGLTGAGLGTSDCAPRRHQRMNNEAAMAAVSRLLRSERPCRRRTGFTPDAASALVSRVGL